MPENEDFGCQCGSRSEQPDQGVPDQPARSLIARTIDRFAGVSHCFGFAVGTGWGFRHTQPFRSANQLSLDQEGFLSQLPFPHFLPHPARRCPAPGPSQAGVPLAPVLGRHLPALHRANAPTSPPIPDRTSVKPGKLGFERVGFLAQDSPNIFAELQKALNWHQSKPTWSSHCCSPKERDCSVLLANNQYFTEEIKAQVAFSIAEFVALLTNIPRIITVVRAD
jgi:hypothetical protein